jgi:hypothetical protein
LFSKPAVLEFRYSTFDSELISRKGAKFAKVGDGIKVVFLQEVTEITEMNQKTLFPLFSLMRRGFFAFLASWRDELFI